MATLAAMGATALAAPIELSRSRAPQSTEQSLLELAAYAREQHSAAVSELSFPAPQKRVNPNDMESLPPVWPAWDRPLPACTHPTALELCPPDVYGQGPLLQHFEAHVANILGKEAAVFVPTGTMAQQVALRLHAQGRNRIFACHPKSHLLLHESNAFDLVCGFSALSIGSPSTPMTAVEVDAAFARHWKQPCALLVELPDRELGGQAITWDDLLAIRQCCDKRGIKMHCDGARLLEIAPHFRRSLQEICSLFDSVYLSLYKGLGGPSGALLLGSADFVRDARPWLHRLGGRAWQVGANVLAAQKAFNSSANDMHNRRSKMQAIVAAATLAQDEFTQQHRAEIDILLPNTAAASHPTPAAAMPADGVLAEGTAAPASSTAASDALASLPQPFFHFVPAVPTCGMVHVYLHVSGAVAVELKDAAAASCGSSLFQRLRATGARQCCYEFTLGKANQDIDTDTFTKAFQAFIAARMQQLRRQHKAQAESLT